MNIIPRLVCLSIIIAAVGIAIATAASVNVVLDRARVDESIRDRADVRHAMELYRTWHTNCEWCLSPVDVEVHHVQPLWLAPWLAADTNNMVCLCGSPAGGCHLRVGHAGDFTRRAVTNLKQVIEMRVVVTRGVEVWQRSESQ